VNKEEVVRKKIMKKLEEYGIENVIADDSSLTITAGSDSAILVYKDGKLCVSYCAASKPDEAARFTLILKEVSGLEIEIAEPYFYRKDKLITGDEAYTEYMATVARSIIDQFIDEQKKAMYLAKVEGFRC